MRQIVKNNPVVSFFILAFLIGFGIAGPLILSINGIIPVRLPGFLGLIAASSSTLAAFIVVSLAYGKSGTLSLLKRIVNFKVHAKWYLFAIFINPIMIVLALGLSAFLGGTFPSFTQKLASLVPVFIIVTLQAGLGEEVGWRGFATPKLQTQFSGLMACLILGVLWSFWHLPLYFIPDGIQENMWLALGFLPAFLFYTLHLVASSVIYTWSYNESGSLLMPIILHGSLNTAAWFFGSGNIPLVGILPVIFLTIFEVILAGFIIKFSEKDLGWSEALDMNGS